MRLNGHVVLLLEVILDIDCHGDGFAVGCKTKPSVHASRLLRAVPCSSLLQLRHVVSIFSMLHHVVAAGRLLSLRIRMVC